MAVQVSGSRNRFVRRWSLSARVADAEGWSVLLLRAMPFLGRMTSAQDTSQGFSCRTFASWSPPLAAVGQGDFPEVEHHPVERSPEITGLNAWSIDV